MLQLFWTLHRIILFCHGKLNTFLLKLLRHDGWGDYMDLCVCGNCSFSHPEFCCMDCFSGELFCSLYIMTLHTRNPLHRIEVSCCTYHLNYTHVCAEMDRIFVCFSVTQTARVIGTTRPSDWRGLPITLAGIQWRLHNHSHQWHTWSWTWLLQLQHWADTYNTATSCHMVSSNYFRTPNSSHILNSWTVPSVILRVQGFQLWILSHNCTTYW